MTSPNNPRSGRSQAVAMPRPFLSRLEMPGLRKKMDLVCVTVAILGIHIVFRLMILMRKMNY